MERLARVAILGHLQTHTAYLEDPWFWLANDEVAVLDVLQSGTAGAPRAFAPGVLPARSDPMGKWHPAGYRASDRV